jgi:hypothetical protein
MREWYAKNAETHRKTALASRNRRIEAARAYDRWRGRRPASAEKERARQQAWNAANRGDIQRQPCEVCGVEKVDAHHDDYSKPLEVRWLCRAHHMEVHRVYR